MQNPIQKFRQSSILFEKPGILSENLETLTNSNYPTVQYFLLKLCTRFLLTNVYKKTSFPNKSIENADPYKPALNKIMTTYE